MNNEKGILIEPKIEKIKSTIEYLNKNIGLTTLCFSAVVAFISGAFKLLSYAFERGKLDYFGINPVYINIAGENKVYSLFLQLTVAVLIIAVNLVPYVIITARAKFRIKLLGIVLTIFIFNLIFSIYFTFSLLSENQPTTLLQILKDIPSLKLITYYSLICSVFILSTGIICGIANNSISNFSNKDYKRLHRKLTRLNFFTKISKSCVTLFIILLSVVAYTLSFYWVGHTTSRDMKDYRIIKDSQVVLYEGDNFYIVSECRIFDLNNLTTLNIYTTIQTQIEKSNITTELNQFDKVNVNPPSEPQGQSQGN